MLAMHEGDIATVPDAYGTNVTRLQRAAEPVDPVR